MSKQRVTSQFTENAGKWSYTVLVDGAPAASGDGFVSEKLMRASMDRDAAAARRNLEAEEATRRLDSERRPAVLLLASTTELATSAQSFARTLLKLPPHIEVAPLQAPYGEVPEGLRPVGLCSLGVDFSDVDTHRWALDYIVPLLGRGAVFVGIESDIDDIVPAGARRMYPFLNL